MGSIADVWGAERAALMPLPPRLRWLCRAHQAGVADPLPPLTHVNMCCRQRDRRLRHAKGVLSARRNRPRGGLIGFEHEEDQEMIRGIVSPTQGYSVPASFANRPVSLRVHPDRLVVVPEARPWRPSGQAGGRAGSTPLA